MRLGKAHFLPALAALGALLLVSLGTGGGALAQSGYLNYGQVSTPNPSYAGQDGNNKPVSLDILGALRVNCIEGCTASSGITATQGTPGASPWLTTDSSDASNAAGTIAAKSSLTAGYFLTTPPTLSNNQQAPFLLDSLGNLKVNIAAGAAAGGTSSTFGSTFPTVGTAIGLKFGANMVNGTADASGNMLVNCATGCTAASDTSNGPVTPGAAATTSKLAGGQFNTVLPTLANTQQAAIQVDSNGRILTNLATPVPAGSNVIGQVGGTTVSVTQTPTVTVAAYTAGQCVGGLMTFAGAARSGGPGSGLMQSGVITDVAGQDSAIDIVLFNANPTNSTFTDHATCTVANADLGKVIGVIPANDPHLLGATAPGVVQSQQQAMPFALGSGNTTLYAVNIARGTPTYTATSNISDRLTFFQD